MSQFSLQDTPPPFYDTPYGHGKVNCIGKSLGVAARARSPVGINLRHCKISCTAHARKHRIFSR